MDESRQRFNPDRDDPRQYEGQEFDERAAREERARDWHEQEERQGRPWGEQRGRMRPEEERWESRPRAWHEGPGYRTPYGSEYDRWQGREHPEQSREFYGQGEASYGSDRGGESHDRPYGYRGYSPTGDTPRWGGGSRWSGEDLERYRRYGGPGGRQYGGPADRSGWNPDYGPSRPFSDPRYGRQNEPPYGHFMGHESRNFPAYESDYPGRGRYENERNLSIGEHMRELGGAVAGRIRRVFRSPKGYKRSDERIREDVCDQLAQYHVDPSEIEVSVSNGEVTLTGTVSERYMKWHAEQIIDEVGGVVEIHNQLRVRRAEQTKSSSKDSRSSSMGTPGSGRSHARS
jgi:hypothetical protein